jgi:beta-N-acetylhexosaminidase
MMGHVIVEAIDPEYPATLSKKLVTDYLRGKLGFKGFIMTDAMRMKAIADNYGIGPASVMAIKAGCDLLLLRGDMDHFMQGYSAVLAAAESGEIEEEWIDKAIERVLLAKERAGLFKNPYGNGEVADKIVGSPEHRAMLKEFADKSITIVRGENLPLASGKKILAVTVEPQKIAAAMDELQCVDMLPKAIRRNNPDTETLVVELDPTDKDIAAALEAAKGVDTVIFATCDAILYPNQVKLAKALYECGKPFIAVAMNSPYDLIEMDFVKNYVCTYGVARQWVESASDVIFGKLKGDAKLPVDIK